MKIPEKFADNYLPHSLSRHQTLNAILNYQDHPNIRAMKRVSQRFPSFYFSPVGKNTVAKEIKKLKSNKAVQDIRDIPVKIFKDNTEFFAEYIYLQYNKTIRSSNFYNCFKFANIAGAHLNKAQEIQRIITGQSTYHL